MSNYVNAWHFVGKTLRDGRPIPRDGEWLVYTGEATICKSGLHASHRPAHALEYAPGAVLCRVECDDIITEHSDKFVCRRRRIVQRADITQTLYYYARMQALSVIHLYDTPADAVLDYLATGDESIRAAARDAAWAAAWASARAAARDAAWAAARAAARDAAWAAARAAARGTARAAARDTAWASAWAAAWASARAAARDAAWAAAWAAAQRDFDALVYEQFGVMSYKDAMK